MNRFRKTFTCWFMILMVFFVLANLAGLIREMGLKPFRVVGFPFAFATWGFDVVESIDGTALILNVCIAIVSSLLIAFLCALAVTDRPPYQLDGNYPMTEPSQKTSLAPMLSVRHGASAVEFYKKAFAATEEFRIESADGHVVARMSIDGAEFWLADESPEHLNYSPETLNGSTVRMVLTVDNPDAVFDRVVAAGAKVISPVVDQPYGWRVGRVADPYGHHWEIGKEISGPSS